MINIRKRHRICDSNPSLVLLPHSDVRRLFVQSDAEALEFRFDDFFVAERFEDVEDDENEVTCPCDWSADGIGIGVG